MRVSRWRLAAVRRFFLAFRPHSSQTPSDQAVNVPAAPIWMRSAQGRTESMNLLPIHLSARVRNAFVTLTIASFLLVRECPAPIQLPDDTVPPAHVPKRTQHREKKEPEASLKPEERELIGKYTYIVKRGDNNGTGEITISASGGHLVCSGRFGNLGMIPLEDQIVASGSTYSSRGVVTGFAPGGVTKLGTFYTAKLAGDFSWSFIPSKAWKISPGAGSTSGFTKTAEISYDLVNRRIIMTPPLGSVFMLSGASTPSFQKH